jgi:excisionase family DNA binding protein
MNPQAALITVNELTHYLQVKPETVRHMARKRAVPAFKVGCLISFSKDEIEILLKSQKAKEQP